MMRSEVDLVSHSDRNTDIGTQRFNNRPAQRWLFVAALALTISSFGWTLAYLSVAIPGRWLTDTPEQRFSGAQMTVTRGTGFSDGTNFIITATDASGLAIVTIDTPTVHADDYRRITWKAISADPDVTLASIWRTGAAPERINSVALVPYAEDLLVGLPQPPEWSGRIKGIALTVKGKLRQPIVVAEARIEPMNLRSVVSDRLSDWFRFSAWTGLSINTAIGGPLEQPIWFPLTVAIIGITAIALCYALARRRLTMAALSLSVCAIVGAGWLVLDARWLWFRLEQTKATAAAFSGKSLRERHLADFDGYVYAFAEQVILRLPKTTSRIFVGADDHYFGGRLAYHLYPHNVYMNHDTGSLPAVELFRPGDIVVVFRRTGVVYDPVERMLSWDQRRAVPADILIAHHGNAAFRLR